jgi:hypothetical protein
MAYNNKKEADEIAKYQMAIDPKTPDLTVALFVKNGT